MNTIDLFPPGIEESTKRWDREWMNYFSAEEAHPHIVSHERLRAKQSLQGLSCSEVFELSPLVEIDDAGKEIDDLVPLHIWVEGDELAGKRVLEIGCGCGWLGKRLGFFVEEYMGIDFSELAIAIARGSSPTNCHYHHIGDRAAILGYQETMDILVGREFFIHQNQENARWVLGLGAALLKPGGQVSADFYLPNPKVRQGVIHPAAAPVDPKYPSCAFLYTEEEINSLARESGFHVVDMTDWPSYQRRFVRLRKA